MKRSIPFAFLPLFAVLTIGAADRSLGGSPTQARHAEGRTVIGIVSSAETRNVLQGAVVVFHSQQQTVLTDNAGRFVLTDVAAGPAEISISYVGFDTHRQTVIVSESEATRLAVELKPSLALVLDAYLVSTQREGNALAITQQRNANNVKNVMAMDAMGNLPTSNVGELLVQLPGIAGVLDTEGNTTGVSVRGMPGTLTRMTVDGVAVSGVGSGGGDRNPTMHSFSAGLYEELEVTKGQTPDMSADSIGGMINIKSRSSLSMTDRRRITYNFGARWAPSFFERTPMRSEHPIHPLTSAAYQEVFDVREGSRNLGIAVSFSYNENVNVQDYLLYNYGSSSSLPNFVWDFRARGAYNNRHVTSANVKAEYRHSDASKFEFNFIYNQGNENGNYVNEVRAITNQVVATLDANGQPTGTGGVMPGFTSRSTTARGVAASYFELVNRAPYLTFFSKTPTASIKGEHTFGRLAFDYHARYSNTRVLSNAGMRKEGGELTMGVPNVGWTLEYSDPERPVFRQTSGADIYNIGSYTRNVSFVRRDNVINSSDDSANGNFRYKFATHDPLSLAAGLAYRNGSRETRQDDARRWTRVTNAPAMPMRLAPLTTRFEVLAGRKLPDVEKTPGLDRELSNPTLWTEDLYYNQSQKYISKQSVEEEISAAYVMAKGKQGRLGYLAGVRVERTEVTGSGYIRGVLATAAQIPDPVVRATKDYNNQVTQAGDYSRSFPSLHLYYSIAENLIARASWSTSFGRPPMAQLAPTATVNDSNHTVVSTDPGIGPQYAENIDLSLEYYFRPAGLASIGYFRKDIRDYLVTSEIGPIGEGPNNGFAGLYAGYMLSSTINAGTAKITGFEFNFLHQLTFLPGLLRGLGISANWTELRAEGDFGGASTMRTNEVAQLIPRTANASLSYTYRKFGARMTLNHTGEALWTYNASPYARIYREPLTTLNVGISYRLTPRATLYCDATNVTEESVSFYRYDPSQFREARKMQSAVIFGVSGAF